MGLVTAGKFANGGLLELTVTVRPNGEQQSEVRVNAIFNTKAIEDPKVYQNFFTVLEKSLFVSNG
jgi:hypothetical protein